MAAGRGDFYRSLREGIERTRLGPGLGPGPGHCRRQLGPAGGGGPGHCARQPGPDGGGPSHGQRQPDQGEGSPGRRRRKKQKRAASGRQRSGNKAEKHDAVKTNIMESTTETYTVDYMTEDFMERLPSEVLMKILYFLDPPALLSISQVCKHLHRLANDSVMWQKIYLEKFGARLWKPKWVEEVKEEEEEEKMPSHWKRMYLWEMSGQEISKWRKDLQEISPYTGLPLRTGWVLRSLNLGWELTVRDALGREVTLQQSLVYPFESCVIVCWSGAAFPRYHHIRSIRLHTVRRDPRQTGARRPGWRSLLVELDLHRGRCIGRDRLIKLIHLSPGFIVGVWRGLARVAFIMVSLHFHRLVERSLLGSPACPYYEPSDRPHVDTSDPEFGLHGYTLHVTLHGTCTEIMSGHFHQLSCSRVQVRRGLLELKAVDRTNLSQHRPLSGNIKLTWRSEDLNGSVEGCCILTLTLLDDSQKPFWCVSSPVCVAKLAEEEATASPDYGGEHFLLQYRSPEGQVKLELVWLNEQQQFFLISLGVYVSIVRVNRHFSTHY